MKEELLNYNIGVLYGGLSSERDVSLRSGENVYQALINLGLKCKKIDIKEDAANVIKNSGINLAYIALHGKYGEDGCIQGLLDTMGVKYTGSGVLASAIGMNKIATKKILIADGIKTPPFCLIDKANSEALCEKAVEDIGFPLVVKPVSEGSSISISIVKDKVELLSTVNEILLKYNEVFVEKFISGKEITIGVLGNGVNAEALPILELESTNEFYDYQAKYTKGMTKFILPARLEDNLYKEAQSLAVKVHNSVGCVGVSRVDSIVDDNDVIWTIEINTSPGMTETSDIPAEAKEAGISFEKLVEKICYYAISNF